MKQVITLPTGDFTCSLSSGCGAFCSAIATAGNTSASTTATAKQPPSSSVNAPIAGTSMLASTEARSPTPAPSPVEGERAVRYDATGYPSSMGMYVLYVDHKKLTASLRSSLAAARAEVEAYKRAKSENDERFMIERDEARAEAGRAQDRALEAEREASGLASDLAALKLRVERADALAENVQRCQRAEGPCPVCKAAAADYLAVVPTVEKGAGK